MGLFDEKPAENGGVSAGVGLVNEPENTTPTSAAPLPPKTNTPPAADNAPLPPKTGTTAPQNETEKPVEPVEPEVVEPAAPKSETSTPQEKESIVEEDEAPIEVNPENYSGDSGMGWEHVARLVKFSLDYVQLPEGNRAILRTLAAPAPARGGRGRKKVQLPEDEPIAVAQALMGDNILVDGYWFIGEVMGALRDNAMPTFDQGMRWVVTVQESAPEFLGAMFVYLNAVSTQFPTGEPVAEPYKVNTPPSEVVNEIRIAATSINKDGHDIIETMQSILAIWPGH